MEWWVWRLGGSRFLQRLWRFRPRGWIWPWLWPVRLWFRLTVLWIWLWGGAVWAGFGLWTRLWAAGRLWRLGLWRIWLWRRGLRQCRVALTRHGGCGNRGKAAGIRIRIVVRRGVPLIAGVISVIARAVATIPTISAISAAAIS